MDLWTNRQMRSFSGITAHFILNWQMESVILGCTRFKGHHVAEKIYQQYEEAVSHFQITEKVRHIVTDTASNMVKAFKLPGFQNEEDEEDDEEVEEDDSGTDDEVESGTVFDSLPAEHHGCFAHILQLVVKDGFKNASQIERIVNKCSKIVSKVRRSTISTEALGNCKALQPCNATRWNSQLKMLRSIINVPSTTLDSIDAPKLSAYERNMITDIMEVLAPFEEATDFAQIENCPSAGYVLPCIRGLEHQLINLTSKYHSSFVTALRSSLMKRMAVYEKKNDYNIAAMLDPRFKLFWCRDEDEKERVKAIVECELARVVVCVPHTPIVEESSGTIETECEPSSKKRRLFTFMDESRSNRSEPRHQKRELQEYLEEPCVDEEMNPLTYWIQNQSVYPSLSVIAQRVLGIPSSSAAVERLFSIAGKVFRPERCRLTDCTFNKLMFVKCNNKFFKQ